MQINKTRLILVSVGIVAALAIVAAIVYNASKSVSNQAQELSRRADTILANRNITAIKDLKHIWELAPFVGKSIQLYGQIIFDPRSKSETCGFAVNGNSKLCFSVGAGINWAKKQGLLFSVDGNILKSNYCIINGNLAFKYFDENIPHEDIESFPGGYGYFELFYPALVKIFTSQPQENDIPNSVTIAPYNNYAAQEVKFLFSGLDKDASWLNFAHYISILEKQNKEASGDKTKARLQQATIEYMTDLIPFVGTSVELKGKILENNKFGFKYWIVLNEERNIAVPFFANSEEARNIGKPCIVKGYLVFRYLKPENNNSSFPHNGHLFLIGYKQLGKLLSPEEIQDNLLPDVRQIPDIEMQIGRKNFITGYYCDADARALKNFIINIMKEETEKSDSKNKK